MRDEARGAERPGYAVSMTWYTLLKFLHVLFAITALGSNLTYAFWLRRAGRDQARILFAIEGIRFLDRRIANPAYILLLVTGIAVGLVGEWSFGRGWLATAIGLYVLTAIVGITLFAPAIRRQLAAAQRDPADAAYAAAARRTNRLALLTTAVVVTIVFLMVTKPF